MTYKSSKLSQSDLVFGLLSEFTRSSVHSGNVQRYLPVLTVNSAWPSLRGQVQWVPLKAVE